MEVYNCIRHICILYNCILIYIYITYIEFPEWEVYNKISRNSYRESTGTHEL